MQARAPDINLNINTNVPRSASYMKLNVNAIVQFVFIYMFLVFSRDSLRKQLGFEQRNTGVSSRKTAGLHNQFVFASRNA